MNADALNNAIDVLRGLEWKILDGGYLKCGTCFARYDDGENPIPNPHRENCRYKQALNDLYAELRKVGAV